MNDGNEIDSGAARRFCRVQPDDPRIAGCVEWLCKQGWSLEAQAKVLCAIIDAAFEAGVLVSLEEARPENEVRLTGVAEEVQGGKVP